MRLAEFQARLRDAVLDPALAARDAELAIATSDATACYRIAIHHSHFWNRMRDFAAYRYPLLARFLGDAELGRLVRQYIVARPTLAFTAAAVVTELVTFVGEAAPWAEAPILRELAAFDFVRSGLRLQREEVTATAEDLAAIDRSSLARVKLRLKSRSALVTTRYAFRPDPLAGLALDSPLDDEPTYWLLHIAHRGVIAKAVERRTYDAMRLLIAGVTIRDLIREMSLFSFAIAEIDGFVDRCLRADLLVAVEGDR